ncbi:MAG: matrixin family metalloprotease [bacterium]
MVATFNARSAAYEKQVKRWNSQNGAPKNEYDALNLEQAALETQLAALNQKQDALNSLIDQINATVAMLNSIAQQLNLKVADYNTLGQANSEEFSEGEYVSDASGIRINIYQFTTQDKLLRVLEHELGHALHLEHVADPEAIMYRLNSGSSLLPTPADLTELTTTCWK